MIFCFIWNEKKKKIDQKDEKRNNNERTKQFKDKQK